ncbi:cholinesterase-like [Amphiura filiformis]|uniref:cholinesterase-like n=1 Tax=Amphiura filiformis TaxID=82378 RepID=UPI003B20FE4A
MIIMKTYNLLPFNMHLSGVISRTIGISTINLAGWVFAISIIILCEAAQTEQENTVNTMYGKIFGSRKRVYDGFHQHHHVTAFLGVPYAMPPVGERRYMPPEPIKPWSGPINATFYGYACVAPLDDAYEGFEGSEQWNPNVEMSEDCLFLNVWTPEPRVSERMTVMVWIFGGGFVSGCASLPLYDGSYLAATHGVVVVSMNYRVGSFGFLSFGTPEAPGNMGLLDQTLALQWVQDNIKFFGGNPDDVTIFGESAGAASVGLHLLSPLSSPLFNRAIFQSGSPVTPWAIVSPEEANRRAMMFATRLNCTQHKEGSPNKTIPEMLTCLRTRDAKLDILLHEYVVSGVYVFPFIPVVDGTFLTETPSSSLERYAIKNTDILLGVNKNEGSFFMPYSLEEFNKDTNSPINRTMYHKIIQKTMKHLNEFGRSAIAFQYTDWLYPDDVFKLRDATESYIADYNIVCPSHRLAQAYVAAKNKVYMYKFNQRTTNNPWGEWMGVLHGDEVAFVFGKPLDAANGFSVQEKHLSAKMMRLWSNFAKTGNPNKGNPNDPDEEAEGWPYFDEETGQLTYLLDTSTIDNPEVINWPWAKRCAFWNDYLPKLNTTTANINEAERIWKEQFHMWSTKYMVDWKAEFNHYVYNKDQECESTSTSSNDTQ